MKKIIAAFLSAALILVFASGCMGQTTNSANVATGDEASSMKPEDYNNDFEGICNYFAAWGYLNPKDTSKYIEMDASLIGAETGKKFTAADINGVTIELYAFSDKSNDTAKEVKASVKESGTFTILELPSVNAYLSDNEKFLMIYSDNSIDKDNPKTDTDNYKHFEEVLEKFTSFHADEK